MLAGILIGVLIGVLMLAGILTKTLWLVATFAGILILAEILTRISTLARTLTGSLMPALTLKSEEIELSDGAPILDGTRAGSGRTQTRPRKRYPGRKRRV